MNDVHTLVGAYAVDAVDDVERAAFERHLLDCQTCRLELASLREAAVLLAAVEQVEPPVRLREQVLAGIGSIRPLPPRVVPEEEVEVAPERRRFRPVALVAAAAAVIALGVGTPVAWEQLTDDTSQAPTVSAGDQVLAADDAEEYTQSVNGTEVTVVRSRSLNRAVLLAPDMPAPPAGKVYELWLDQGDGMVPAGVMTGEEETVLFEGEGDPGTAVGAAITVEPAPDGSQAPTTPALLSFTFKKA